jgi:putative membrane protein
MTFDPRDLPLVNAFLNGTTTLFLLAGFIFIKQGRINTHRACMVTALITSSAFLTSYLIYHLGFHLQTPFTHPGPVRVIYLTMLASHVLLAIVNLPMILTTVTFAIKGNFERHKKWARWTWPVWMYVSVTGVLVYLMLYVWFPSDALKG